MLPADLQRLVYAFGTDKEEQFKHFKQACESNDIEGLHILVYLQSYVWKLTITVIDEFQRACQFGKFELVQFLIERLNLEEDIRANNNHARYIACRYNQYNVVQLLMQILSVDDIRTDNSKAFYCACAIGHYKIVLYCFHRR